VQCQECQPQAAHRPLAALLPVHLEYPEYKYSMILNELYERSPEAYQDISQDNSQPQLHNTRKTRLTLRQLNKLRQMNDVRNYEYKEKLKLVRQQYAPPPAAPAL
jgi:hypothetical protein